MCEMEYDLEETQSTAKYGTARGSVFYGQLRPIHECKNLMVENRWHRRAVFSLVAEAQPQSALVLLSEFSLACTYYNPISCTTFYCTGIKHVTW